MTAANIPAGLSWIRKYLLYALIAGAGVAATVLYLLFDLPLS
jgi:hypothetical protein